MVSWQVLTASARSMQTTCEVDEFPYGRGVVDEALQRLRHSFLNIAMSRC